LTHFATAEDWRTYLGLGNRPVLSTGYLLVARIELMLSITV